MEEVLNHVIVRFTLPHALEGSRMPRNSLQSRDIPVARVDRLREVACFQ